jgi:hypothetical protein
MVADGAVLVALITGIGEAWHHEKLRPLFVALMDIPLCLPLAIMSWISLALARSILNGDLGEEIVPGWVGRWFGYAGLGLVLLNLYFFMRIGFTIMGLVHDLA